MNIVELNAQGQDLSTFVYTALAILLVTGTCWFITIQRAEYHRWEAQTPAAKNKTHTYATPRYCLVARLRMLSWLFQRGHARWLWSTNAWIGLLTHDTLGSFKMHDEWENDDCRSSCQYVTRHYKDTDKGKTPFILSHNERNRDSIVDFV